VVIDDLDVVRISFRAPKADPSLVIDTDAVLAGPAARELLQPIGCGHAEVVQAGGGVQHQQLAQTDPL